jgi:hypothetical protein
LKRTDPQFKLRLPQQLKQKVEKSADKASRTLSNEIIFRLEWSFEAEGRGETRGLFMSNLSMLSEDELDYLAGRVAARLNRSQN